MVVGAVFAGERLEEGVLSGRLRRNGNSTYVLEELVTVSRFYPRLHTMLLQGTALADFNMIEVKGFCTSDCTARYWSSRAGSPTSEPCADHC